MNDNRFIAMIALEKAVTLNAAQIASAIRAMFPEFALKVGNPPVEDEAATGFLIPVGDFAVTVIPFPFAIPKETLSSAIGNELMWKEAGAAFLRSKAHILFSVISAKERANAPAAYAQALTLAIAAILPEVPALGVYWSNAEMVIEPERFTQEAKAAGLKRPPNDLWVGFRYYQGKKFARDQSIVCRTSGLAAFTGRELECGPYAKQPGELASMLRSIAAYMVETGTDFGEGHTLGDGPNTFGRVSLTRSDYGGDNMAIYKIELIQETSNRRGQAR